MFLSFFYAVALRKLYENKHLSWYSLKTVWIQFLNFLLQKHVAYIMHLKSIAFPTNRNLLLMETRHNQIISSIKLRKRNFDFLRRVNFLPNTDRAWNLLERDGDSLVELIAWWLWFCGKRLRHFFSRIVLIKRFSAFIRYMIICQRHLVYFFVCLSFMQAVNSN